MRTIFALMIFATLAHAEPITFQLSSATIGGKEFTPAQANGEWIHLDGYRIKLMANGMPGVGDELGLFWAAQTAAGTPEREFRVSLKGKLCYAGGCANIETGGLIATSAAGMYWKLPPPAWTVELDNGKLVVITSKTNQPRPGNPTGTIDLDLIGSGINAEVPEPTSLTLLGLGLGLMARRMRRKK